MTHRRLPIARRSSVPDPRRGRLRRVARTVVPTVGIWLSLASPGPLAGRLEPAGQPGPAAGSGVDEVAPGLYVMGDGPGNVAVRVTPDGVVLVDPGVGGGDDGIRSRLRALTDRPVAHVVHTHHHRDHAADTDLRSATATVLAHANTRGRLVESGHPGPTMVFRRSASLFLGDIEVRAHHLGPGHTDGDLVVEFPDLRVVHTGDLVVIGPPLIDYEAGGDSRSWVETLGRLLQLEFDTAIPGHGPALSRAEVRRFRDGLVTLRARVSQLIEQEIGVDALASRLVTDDLGWSIDPGGPFATTTLPGLHRELAGPADGNRTAPGR